MDDSFGIEIGDGKGLFIQVIDYGEGLEYLIELNDVENGAFEPCANYNESSEFGNIEKLKETIVDYLKHQDLLN